jgi:hypothetical protein
MDMKTMTNINGLVDEYQAIIDKEQDTDWDTIKRKLVDNAEWSERAANELSFLAKHYGTFILRNALALSVVLGIEDGEAGL